MPWDDNLLENQRIAASSDGSRVVLLAGPGTGKTLTITRRICYLIEVNNVAPRDICVITFSRAAAAELRKRITDELGEQTIPYIATLHSFALRQLLRLANYANSLPRPIRIADDWEERHIILEDIKRFLGLNRISNVSELLSQLSSDWQSLTADEADWEQRFPNPRFIGAWRVHRQIYAYSLRSELVYQLKHTVQQNPDVINNLGFENLLIDEYQDLNRCDLAVVKSISDTGLSLYVSGDDDQSIYGFRKAHPIGIRRFTTEYNDSESLNLNICKRCDQNILDFSLFVANQDPFRLDKEIVSDSTQTADIRILRFSNQYNEAEGISNICRYLINHEGIQPHGILILLRSNKHNYFSTTISNYLTTADIEVKTQDTESSIFDIDGGRQVLSYLRLIINSNDELALRTLIQLDKGSGQSTIESIYNLSQSQAIRFSAALRTISENPTIIERLGNQIKTRYDRIRSNLERYTLLYNPIGISPEAFNALINTICTDLELSVTLQIDILTKLGLYADDPDREIVKLDDVLREKDTSLDTLEVVFEEGKVHIMTMHKAKGLTAEAVIIAAAEDEYIPFKCTNQDEIMDELRLLYVSLTRAKHYLYITYCNSRIDNQCFTGRTSGSYRRNLTRFLSDAPIQPIDGVNFTRGLIE